MRLQRNGASVWSQFSARPLRRTLDVFQLGVIDNFLPIDCDRDPFPTHRNENGEPLALVNR